MQFSGLKQTGSCQWELPPRGSMRVPVRLFGNKELIQSLDPEALEQASNVACLPGIVRASLCMPDAHWGYGFPIGGVAAFDPNQGGVISVGGIGYDISCGVRTLLTGLKIEEVRPSLEQLADRLFKKIPSGLGSAGLIDVSKDRLDQVMLAGAKWAVENGFGESEDLENIEDKGFLNGADPRMVSQEARKRQKKQLGSLGSGNHYLEVQYVQAIYDHNSAQVYGLAEDDIVISFHCGSRALGHQIASDYIKVFQTAAKEYGIALPQKELVCAPILSPKGEQFYQAMACGVNWALANRQVISHLVREVFAEIFAAPELKLLYDVSHNTCKPEKHQLENGSSRRLYVHRKGATRAFGPGRPEIPAQFRAVGQPVIIGGTMGTNSYILAGSGRSEELSWSSACHGAGRIMSRRQASKKWKAGSVINNLAAQGILIRSASGKGAAEEAPQAYKDVNAVVESTEQAGLARKIAKLAPLACIKG